MAGPSGYAAQRVTFATMHHKERLAREPFHRILGAEVTAPLGLDTDQFGTFSGEVPRTLTPLDAARVKARLGMQMDGTTLGLASEGSFTAGFGIALEHTELLLFIDDERNLELVESVVGPSPVPPGRAITSVAEAHLFAQVSGFPRQGLMVLSVDSGGVTVHKNLETVEVLIETVRALLATSPSVTLEPDHRAHAAPARATVIHALAERLAQRLATDCPRCGTPGFGRIDVEPGLRCQACGTPTHIVAADLHGCGGCRFTERAPREQCRADPRWCDRCNP